MCPADSETFSDHEPPATTNARTTGDLEFDFIYGIRVLQGDDSGPKATIHYSRVYKRSILSILMFLSLIVSTIDSLFPQSFHRFSTYFIQDLLIFKLLTSLLEEIQASMDLHIEVVKQRMLTCQFASAPDVVRLIVSKEGFKGLICGMNLCWKLMGVCTIYSCN
ncbi:hypothetical protein Ccrd_015110 [Cynara cardunculus var. scolymus]|uniref:Uncharacterized protein n=1 Tax=Cynara cardunculus var. scolymus TaxID=59895 RepID=A0A124SGI9_CYNCS|nr:hypothetical protein Ccrd_015110 [Cynara cardunculus var. scolymus]